MDINIIKSKSKKKFKDNILSKNELKYIFIYTYDDKRISNIGLPIHNKSDNICYFITGFNMIARLQYIIYKEIDNLIELDEINKYITNIKQNVCLNDIESKKFNKYLLIQTLIEIHSEDIMKKIYNNRYDEYTIQDFIETRLSEYSFSESTLNKSFDHKFIEYLQFRCKELKEKSNNLFKKKYNQYLDTGYIYKIIGKKLDKKTDKTEFDGLLEGNMTYLKKISDIEQLFKNIDSFINKTVYNMNDIKYNIDIQDYNKIKENIVNNIKILLENIGKYFCKITDENGDIKLFKLKKQTDILNISELYNDFYIIFTESDIQILEKDFTEIYNDLKDLLRLTYYKIEGILKITDFKQITPDVACDIKQLNNVDRNIKFLQENLAVKASRSGSESSIVVNTLIEMLDTNFIETTNIFNFSDKPYYIYNQSNRIIKGNLIPQFLQNKYTINKNGKTYRLCTVSFVCTGHSVSAICYSDNCDSGDFLRINESNLEIIKLKQINGQYNLGKLCNFNQYYIDKMIYECVNHIDELKTEIELFITQHNLQINPKPEIAGGALKKYTFINKII